MNRAAEEWRPVIDWLGYYEVSSHGRVRSVERTVTRCNGTTRRVRARVLRECTQPQGYRIVTLCRSGQRVVRKVHALVAESFHGPRPDGMECRHVNGDPSDNGAANLMWGTSSQNHLDQVRHGTHHWASKTHCKRGHEFNDQNTYRPPGSATKRYCRACRHAAKKAVAA